MLSFAKKISGPWKTFASRAYICLAITPGDMRIGRQVLTNGKAGRRRYGCPTEQVRRLIVGRKAPYIRDFGGEAVLACRDGRGSTVLPRAVLPAI